MQADCDKFAIGLLHSDIFVVAIDVLLYTQPEFGDTPIQLNVGRGHGVLS